MAAFRECDHQRVRVSEMEPSMACKISGVQIIGGNGRRNFCGISFVNIRYYAQTGASHTRIVFITACDFADLGMLNRKPEGNGWEINWTKAMPSQATGTLHQLEEARHPYMA